MDFFPAFFGAVMAGLVVALVCGALFHSGAVAALAGIAGGLFAGWKILDST